MVAFYAVLFVCFPFNLKRKKAKKWHILYIFESISYIFMKKGNKEKQV